MKKRIWSEFSNYTKRFLSNLSQTITGKSVLSDEAIFEFLCNTNFFSGIPPKELRKLYRMGHQITLNAGDYLFKEGETPNEFYIVIDGALEILKYDTVYRHEHKINTVHAGQPVGEMGLIDNQPRSASVRAKTKATLFCVPFAVMAQLANKTPDFSLIYHRFSKVMSERLRHTNDAIISALEKQIEDYKLRVGMGRFMVNVMTAICLFTFSLAGLIRLAHQIAVVSLITFLLTFFFAIAVVILIKTTGLPLATFGITTRGWQPAIKEAIIFSIPIMIITILIKWFEIHYVTYFAGRDLIEPLKYLAIKAGESASPMYVETIWLVSMLLYVFVGVPLQELIARGGLQGPLETFLTGKYKTWTAIFVSNLLFTTVHVWASVYVALLVFGPGLLFGWLYSRHKTLIGVWISHVMIGVWGFWIVGIYG